LKIGDRTIEEKRLSTPHMVLTLTIASKEVEDFVLKIKIDADATFADLQEVIREGCGWSHALPAAFYVCDERWHPEHYIPEEGDYEHDAMNEVELGSLLEDEGQRLLYQFDQENNRHLLMEVTRVIFGDSLDEPHHRLYGAAPELILEPEEPAPTNADLIAALNAAALGELDEDEEEERDDFEGFDPEEFDSEGYEISEG